MTFPDDIAQSTTFFTFEKDALPPGYKFEHALSVLGHFESKIPAADAGFRLHEPPSPAALLPQRELTIALWYILAVSNSKPAKLRVMRLLAHPNMQLVGDRIMKAVTRNFAFSDPDLRNAARTVVGRHFRSPDLLLSQLITDLRQSVSGIFHFGVEALTLLLADESWRGENPQVLARIQSWLNRKDISVGSLECSAKAIPTPEGVLLWILADSRLLSLNTRFQRTLHRLMARAQDQGDIPLLLLAGACLPVDRRPKAFHLSEHLRKNFATWGGRWAKLAIIEALPRYGDRSYLPSLTVGLASNDKLLQLASSVALLRFGFHSEDMVEILLRAQKNREQIVSGFAKRARLGLCFERQTLSDLEPDHAAALKMLEDVSM